jgi:ABC-type transporter MlaC component
MRHIVPGLTFAPSHTYFQLLVVSFLSSSKMSKTTLASLQTQVTELTSQFAALSARLDSLAPSVASSVPAEKTKKTKKASKPKDPDAPKKPLSSYLLFSAAQRAEVPEGGVKLTASVLAERWKALTPEQQAAYKPVAPVAAAPVAVAEGAKPKRPLNAFMRFQAARRAEAPDAKLTAKALGEEWKALSADQQAAYKTPPVSDADSSDDDGDDTDD